MALWGLALVPYPIYADQNNMKLNLAKTKLMLFNPCTSKDFMPEMVLENKRIELVEQVKLLGVVLSSNLSWSANTDYIVERCYKKMWVLRRLKRLGASHTDLLEFYSKQIRSVAEFAVPVWNSSITGEDVVKLERLQKIAFHIILGEDYRSYTSALKSLGLQKLSTRRRKICLTFAKKSQKHSKFNKWFKPCPSVATRRKRPKFYEIYSKKVRFDKSPLSYLTKLLNQASDKPK